MSNIKISGNGIGFGSLLFIVFLVLKLTNVIDWSWTWVCAPIWLPFVVFMGIYALIIAVAVIVDACKKK